MQVELIGEYEHSPMVTADNTLTLLKIQSKQTRDENRRSQDSESQRAPQQAVNRARNNDVRVARREQ